MMRESAWTPIYGKASHAPWRNRSVSPTPKGEGAGEAFFIGRKMKRKDISGMRFGRWLVGKYLGMINRHSMYECVCDCGTRKNVYTSHIIRGNSNGCMACAPRYQPKPLPTKSTRKTWDAMMYRCYNENHVEYKQYGGRGITVCDEWHSFDSFVRDMGLRPAGMSIERRDNNRGYSKENCEWATTKAQANNRRSNRMVVYDGKEYTVSELADHLKINRKTLQARIYRGTDLDRKVATR